MSDVRLWLSNAIVAVHGYGFAGVAKPITSPVWFMIVVPTGTVWTSCFGWNRLNACPASWMSVRRKASGTSFSA
jgi:hypothetical protein